jgi:hypothetical protein
MREILEKNLKKYFHHSGGNSYSHKRNHMGHVRDGDFMYAVGRSLTGEERKLWATHRIITEVSIAKRILSTYD